MLYVDIALIIVKLPGEIEIFEAQRSSVVKAGNGNFILFFKNK